MTTTNDTTKTAQPLQETPKKVRPIDIYIAPDCEGDILSETPHVAVGPNGKPHLTLLPCLHEDEIGEEVEATASLPLSDLMLVRTKVGAYLMRQSDYHAHLPTLSDAEFHARDLRTWVEAATYGLMHHTAERLDETPRRVWHTAGELLQGNEFDVCLGHLLMLNALIASPDAVQASLRALRDEYVAAHADLQLVEGQSNA